MTLSDEHLVPLNSHQALYVRKGSFMGAAKDQRVRFDPRHLPSKAAQAFKAMEEQTLAARGHYWQGSGRNAALHTIQWSSECQVLTASFDDLAMTPNLATVLQGIEARSRNRLMFPLDVSTLEECSLWCTHLHGEVGVMKVGLQFFTAFGPVAVQKAHEAGFDTFLDLKLHDIPNTVTEAVRACSRLGVRFLSVHASGGSDMVKAAVDASGPDMTILAVTALTSLGDKDSNNVYGKNPADVVHELASIAYDAGARGFVCSGHEATSLKKRFPQALLVVPGVRPLGSDWGDQKRIVTPAEAITAGADFLVVGRPIRSSNDPKTMARAIVAEIQQAG